MIGHSEPVDAATICYRHASSLPPSRYVSKRDEAPTHDHQLERSSLCCISTLQMETACSLETVVPSYQATTACHDSEDHSMNFHLYENLHVHESPMN